MATIIKGLLAQKLPWGPVLVGVFLALMAQLAGAHALSWAVGAYLPVSTTAPIWVGGLMKGLADKMRKAPEEGEIGPGMLYATGLVAGGSLAGIAIALLIGFGGKLATILNVGKGYFDKMGLGGDMHRLRHVRRPVRAAPPHRARQGRLMLGTILYIAACILVPLAWGLFTYAVTRAIEKRRPPAPTKKPAMPELEYYL